MAIKLYWWTGHPNAGDYISYWLLTKMGFKVKPSTKNPELAATGSILEHHQLSENTKIWGAGMHMFDKYSDHTNVNHDNIYAVRGKLTKEALKLSDNVALGDPGILVSKYYKPKVRKSHKFGIACHMQDYEYFKKNYANCFLINMGTNNIEEVLDQINSCKFIFSTSLHGLIFAHAYGIPAIHLEQTNIGSLDNFKFKDYYSILDLNYTKVTVNAIDEIDNYLKEKSNYCPDISIIKEIQNNLLDAFPYKNIKVALCAIAKNENNYIKEWVEHHLNAGIDKIFLFDNNDVDGEHFEDVISNYIRTKKVELIDVRGQRNMQIDSFENCYQNMAKDFDWIGFWDIDEFLILNNSVKDVKELILSPKFKPYNCINICWDYYDDNDITTVENNNYSVLTRFVRPAIKAGKENTFCKRIVKTNIPGVHINSSHGPIDRTDTQERYYDKYIKNPNILACNTAGEHSIWNGCAISNPTHQMAQIRHFRFKSLEEYVTNKMKRGYPTLYKNEGKDLNIKDFFALNIITAEKLAWLAKHDIDTTGFKVEEIKDQKQLKPIEQKKTISNAFGQKANTYLYF